MNANCYYCGQEVTGRAAHTDHFVPKSKGGNNLHHNLVIACGPCNSTKGNRLFQEVRFRLVQRMIGWPKFTLDQLEWLRAQGFDMTAYDSARLWCERSGALDSHERNNRPRAPTLQPQA